MRFCHTSHLLVCLALGINPPSKQNYKRYDAAACHNPSNELFFGRSYFVLPLNLYTGYGFSAPSVAITNERTLILFWEGGLLGIGPCVLPAISILS